MANTRPRRATKRRVPKLREILLADDGSRLATRARQFALKLGAAARARVTVVYVREPIESKEQAQRKLQPMLAAARAAGVACEGIVEPPVGVTNAGRRIIAAAIRRRADVIVVGARGGGIVKRMLGSVSTYVVGRSRVSVCVVR